MYQEVIKYDSFQSPFNELIAEAFASQSIAGDDPFSTCHDFVRRNRKWY
jgi:hypothetical protein